MLRTLFLAAFLSAGLFGGPPLVQAQTNVEVNAGLQLNLSQPGARSLGMGGAFLGLADDATAAYTNPAGLANLSTMEVALEGRAWNYTTTFTDSGVGAINGDQLDASGLIQGRSESSIEDYSFGSFSIPRGRWVVALYRHQLANFETSFETGETLARVGNELLCCVFPVRASTELEIVGTGLAAAVRINDSFALGLSVINYEMVWSSSTRRFPSVAEQDADFWVNQQDIAAEDEGVSTSLGFELKLTERWRLGGVYRRGAEFDFQTASTLGPAAGIFEGFLVDSDDGAFRVPDVYGVGLAYKSASFRILFDWVRVEYSALTETTIDVFTDLEDSTMTASRLTVDDADELHLGFEYVFIDRANPLAVRLGTWLDPDHEIRYEGPIDSGDAFADAVLFRPGSDEIHYTGGLGIALQDGRFELNAAIDLSERVDTASLSFVARFF